MTKGNMEKVISLIKKTGVFAVNAGETQAVILGAKVSMVYMGSDSCNGTDYSVYCDKTFVSDGFSAYTHKETNITVERVSDWNAFGYALFRLNRPTNSLFMIHRDEVETGWI